MNHVVIVLNFPFYSPAVRGFCTSCYPFHFSCYRCCFLMKSCRSFVMEVDAPSSNMRGCESKSKEFFPKLSLKCVDILCMLQCPFDNLVLLCHFCLLLLIFNLRCCLRYLFIPELMHVSRRIQTMFMR